jgi:hemoglobin
MPRRLRHFLALASLLLPGCSTFSEGISSLVKPPSLYVSLGEQPGIEQLVDTFLRELAADARIAHHFADTDIARLRQLLAEQICEVSDGPCRYTGESMPEVHRGLGITAADFNALVEDLMAAMDAVELPLGVQNRLLARLAPMQEEIVE